VASFYLASGFVLDLVNLKLRPAFRTAPRRAQKQRSISPRELVGNGRANTLAKFAELLILWKQLDGRDPMARPADALGRRPFETVRLRPFPVVVELSIYPEFSIEDLR
jgi:hypothetical protein